MVNNAKAMQLDFLDKLDRIKIGEMIPVPITDNEIGGELLNILSKGLYTNPLDSIREYVQNSIDADAEEVEIQVTGNSVYILDRGIGMSREQLLRARDFGVSRKSIEENVGFRGIGLYSGFDLCEKLVLTTKAEGGTAEHILEFDFKTMRDILEEARKNPERPVIPLATLLSENTYYRRGENRNANESYTIVQLEELSDNHIHKLSNVRHMQDYILRNLPIRFSEEFKYAEEIENSLKTYVPGYKSARVKLLIEDAEPVIVEKPNIPDLEAPIKGYLYAQGKEVAYFWACLVSVNTKISSRSFHKGEFKDFEGLAYKIKGFTVGNRSVLRRFFTRIPDWWTGEIFVIDPNVIPTSARDDFEASIAKEALETAVRELINGQNNMKSLQRIAVGTQQRRKADQAIEEIQKDVYAIQESIETGDFDQFQVYSDLDELLRKLNRHEGKASDKKAAKNVIAMVKSLQKIAKKEIDSPTPISKRKRDAGISAVTGKGLEGNGSEDEDDQEKPPHPTGIDDNEQEPDVDDSTENLVVLIEKSGWSIAEEDIELIEILGEAIADIIGIDSQDYARLMANIEERLTEELEEN